MKKHKMINAFWWLSWYMFVILIVIGTIMFVWEYGLKDVASKIALHQERILFGSKEEISFFEVMRMPIIHCSFVLIICTVTIAVSYEWIKQRTNKNHRRINKKEM